MLESVSHVGLKPENGHHSGTANNSEIRHRPPFREKPGVRTDTPWATGTRLQIAGRSMALDEWDDHAAGWDSNQDVRLFAEKAFDSLNRRVLPLVPNLADCQVLDFGCGTGLLSERLAPLCGHVVAVDTSAKMIAVLQNKIVDKGIGKITALQSAVDFTTIGQPSDLAGNFDLIVASSVCNFLPDYEASLRGLRSIMKPGGYFIQWDWLADMPVDRIRGAYEAAGLKAIAVEADFAMEFEEKSLPVVVGLAQLPA